MLSYGMRQIDLDTIIPEESRIKVIGLHFPEKSCGTPKNCQVIQKMTLTKHQNLHILQIIEIYTMHLCQEPN